MRSYPVMMRRSVMLMTRATRRRCIARDEQQRHEGQEQEATCRGHAARFCELSLGHTSGGASHFSLFFTGSCVFLSAALQRAHSMFRGVSDPPYLLWRTGILPEDGRGNVMVVVVVAINAN